MTLAAAADLSFGRDCGDRNSCHDCTVGGKDKSVSGSCRYCPATKTCHSNLSWQNKCSDGGEGHLKNIFDSDLDCPVLRPIPSLSLSSSPSKKQDAEALQPAAKKPSEESREMTL